MDDIQLGFTKPEVYSVSKLVFEIRDNLETRFPDVFVEGEIVGFSKPASGHFYFALKDENAQIQLVMFRMQNRFLRFQPQNGMVVVARGRVSSYPPRGTLQMIVDYMEPKGAGALAAAFEQRKRELAEKGYFAAESKLKIPSQPFTIGMVTSPTGAALYDALRIAFSRHPNLHVILSPCLVQGEGAAAQIALAIESLIEDGRSEVILVIRGGGSAEDLWAFNELAVAEAIHRCPIPIVTGIGHEIDFTIADFCADYRAPTPTGAAEVAVSKTGDMLMQINYSEDRLARQFQRILSRKMEKIEILTHRLQVRGLPTLIPSQQVDELSRRLQRALTETVRAVTQNYERLYDKFSTAARFRIRDTRSAFDSLEQRLQATSPKQMNVLRKQKLQHLTNRLSRFAPDLTNKGRENLEHFSRQLSRSAKKCIQSCRLDLENKESLLQALGPMNVLERGYSITRIQNSRSIVTDADQVQSGQPLDIILHRGELAVKVSQKKGQNEKE